MSDLMRTHRALCTPFVSEDLFRRAFGAGRANIGTIARYLATPIPDRPVLSFYFDANYYRDLNPDVVDAGLDPLIHFIDPGVSEERSPHPLVDIKYILSQDSGLLGAPLHDRLTGSDLFDALWPRLVASATPTVVVASSVEVATGLAHEHAALRCVLPPMFDVDEGDVVGAHARDGE